MTKEQMQIVKNQLIMLDKEDVMQLTNWGENTVNNIFAYDYDFPAIKKGKKYQVELTALKKYLSKRRTNKE